jgi:hypothetical protein
MKGDGMVYRDPDDGRIEEIYRIVNSTSRSVNAVSRKIKWLARIDTVWDLLKYGVYPVVAAALLAYTMFLLQDCDVAQALSCGDRCSSISAKTHKSYTVLIRKDGSRGCWCQEIGAAHVLVAPRK